MPKITIGYLCKPFHEVIIILFSTFTLNLKRLGREKNLKSKLPPRSGSSLEAVESHPQKGAYKV